MTEGIDPAVGDPIAAWAASGAMALTGHADGPPLSPAAAVIPALLTLAHDYTRLATTLASATTPAPRPSTAAARPGSDPAGRPTTDARLEGDSVLQWSVGARTGSDAAGQPTADAPGDDRGGRLFGGVRAGGGAVGGWTVGVRLEGVDDALAAPADGWSGRVGGSLAGEAASGEAGSVEVDVGQLLSGRAGLLGLGRQGQVSANGSCRLLPTADGWAAVNLARPSDVEAVGALVEQVVDADPWAVLARSAERMTGADVVERATLLGIPAAVVPPLPDTGSRPQRPPVKAPFGHFAAGAGPQPALARPVDPGERPGTAASGIGIGVVLPFTLRRLGAPRADRPGRTGPGALTVVDLSAMWAGPLCARLLGLAGLRVVKVESTRRPDGARTGDSRFFDWLHGGHASVAVDLATAGGREALAQLVGAADVVIESSRPRALAQLGIDVEAAVGARPGVTWVSITGHGREGAAGHRVAFGDDAAAAAGLVAHDDRGRPVFCGDAIADPITGLSAAVGALTSIVAGGGHLVDVPMVGAVAVAMAVPATPAAAHRSAGGKWQVATATGVHPVAAPGALPPAAAPAAPLGVDTTAVLHALGVR